MVSRAPVVANAPAVASAIRSYFAALPPHARRGLRALGAIISRNAPRAVAAFSYRIPGFRLDDRALLSYAAWAQHVSLYPVTSGMKRAGGAQLDRFVVSKGTLRFPLSEPLPEALVTKLVKARVAEVRRGDSRAPAAQLTEFISRFNAPVASRLRGARTRMRRRLPEATELVYDNYNFLVIGYCSSPRASDCIVSLAASAKGVVLSFYHGAELPDPEGILLGSGRQNRFVRLESPATLEEPALRALITEAVVRARTPLPKTGHGKLIIRSISAKQRPRRPPPDRTTIAR